MVRFWAGGARRPELFGQLFSLMSRHGFWRATADRSCLPHSGGAGRDATSAGSHLDLVVSTRQQAGDLLAERLTPRAVRNQMQSELINLVPLLRRLPRRINKLSENLERDRLSVNVRLIADGRDRDFCLR